MPIYVGREETERLRRELTAEFNQVQQSLEKARREIWAEFAPMRTEGRSVSPQTTMKFRSGICERLRLEGNAFDELMELFVRHNKAYTGTQWASDFGVTMHLMAARPSFLLVGERHGYIWALYDCMFRRATAPIPVVRVENFIDCVGEKPMNSRNPDNCVCLVESEEIIRDKLSKGLNLIRADRTFALRDVFQKLIATRNGTVSINSRTCGSYQEAMDACNGRLRRHRGCGGELPQGSLFIRCACPLDDHSC